MSSEIAVVKKLMVDVEELRASPEEDERLSLLNTLLQQSTSMICYMLLWSSFRMVGVHVRNMGKRSG